MERWLRLALGAAWLLVAACGYNPVLSPYPPPGHPHLYVHTAAAGENHVSLLVDQPAGAAMLLIGGPEEEPLSIPARSLAATFILPNGERREARFTPTSWTCRKGSCLASEYQYVAPWLKDASRFRLEAVVPIAGTDYPLAFDYSRPAQEGAE